ncbi:MAG TPA: sulfite oxidase [Streptosporangiaceae bacterium]|nr:sulfite oxidase [Streptosporangiaceae bacterium]
MATRGDRVRDLPTADPDRLWREALAAGLVGRSKAPLNCEVTPSMLAGEVTGEGQFFRRNHFPMPELDPGSWQLEVSGLVGRPLSLGLPDLCALPARSLTVTLECAGNGRTLFSPGVPGEAWALGAVSTARWTGALLSDVLEEARILPSAREAIFRGADAGPVAGLAEPIRFERSLPVEDALESGALLAYEMNGQPLPVAHGFPVRLVVPGWYAVASVKWLAEITLTGQPFRGFFQDTHYVYEWRRDGHAEREPVRLQRVRAMIADPVAGTRVSASELEVTGVAWSGAAPVTRVEVRASRNGDHRRDGSAPAAAWQPAELVGTGSRYGWQPWRAVLRDLRAGPALLQARAADAAGNDQLSAPEWNELGYGGNFVHEVPVTVG